MKKKAGIERRKYVRLDAGVKVNCITVKGQRNKISAVTKNISVQGICFNSKKKLIADTLIEIQIRIPGYSKPIRLEGKVVWCKTVESEKFGGLPTFDIGIRLIDIDKSDESKFFMYVLDKVVEKYSKKMIE